MSVRHFILATAGHVDHGKSALIKALTGVDPDRLPEEKARGITIDLGFAHIQLPAPSACAPVTQFSLGIIDVPGHEDFVKNMVAGVGSVDLALLIVAADDGWMPQTEEHLQILSYLGVRHGVVALTKIDLAEGLEDDQEQDIRRRLQQSPLAEAPIVRTSVTTGLGIQALQSTLAASLTEMNPPRDAGKPRMPVDRVFTLQGIGTVVTGTLTGGRLSRGQNVVLQPSGHATRVRSLQSHSRDEDHCHPGTRTAINLPDVEAGSTVARGDVVTVPGLGEPSRTLHVRLEKSGRLKDFQSSGARPLKDGVLVRIHHGSGNWPARVFLGAKGPLEAGHAMLAELRFETPVYALAGDRFIVRDWPELATLGGGIVLDPHGDRASFRDPRRQALLQERAAAGLEVSAWVATELGWRQFARIQHLLDQSCFSAEEIQQEVQSRIREGKAVLLEDWIIDTAWWQKIRDAAEDLIRTEHATHPERSGLALNALRGAMERVLPDADLFPPLLSDLSRRGYVQIGTAIRRESHRPTLPGPLQEAGLKLRAALSAKPFEPPTKKELLMIPQAAPALRFLIETGEATNLSDDTVLLTEALHQAINQIRRYLQKQSGASASELRQILKTNRRVIIPLLEHLDKQGVTVRQGDLRILKPSG